MNTVYVVYGEYIIDEEHRGISGELALICGVYDSFNKADNARENYTFMYGDYDFFIEEVLVQ